MKPNPMPPTETKWTKGPTITYQYVEGCVSYYSEQTQGSELDDEAEANCRLWSAAPELYEALQKAVARQGFTNEELIEAREVLRKAKQERE